MFALTETAEEVLERNIATCDAFTEQRHLCIAAETVLVNATELLKGDLCAYSDGTQVIIKERVEDDWEMLGYVTMDDAEILAQARAFYLLLECEKNLLSRLTGELAGENTEEATRAFFEHRIRSEEDIERLTALMGEAIVEERVRIKQ